MESFREAGTRQKTECQAARIFDLDYLLWRHKPRFIAEMGSGLSTVRLAKYAQRSGAKLLTLEESPEWVGLTSAALRIAGIANHAPTLVTKMQDDEDVWYDYEIPEGVDFFYVDGPSCSTGKDIGPVRTSSGIAKPEIDRA